MFLQMRSASVQINFDNIRRKKKGGKLSLLHLMQCLVNFKMEGHCIKIMQIFVICTHLRNLLVAW